MTAISDIDLLPDDPNEGDLGHSDMHDKIHLGLKAVKNLLMTLDGSALKVIGDQTVAGNKTFSGSIFVPNPTANMHSATKQYVDAGLAGKTDNGHVHSIANITNLQSTLDSKIDLSSTQTVTGLKTFDVSPVAPTPSAGDNTNKVATTSFVTLALGSGVVALTGNQTISGTKLFNNAPRLTPTSTAGYSWVASDSQGNGSWVALSSLAAGGTVPWANVTGKPAGFTPEAHVHSIADITNLSTTLSGKADSSRTIATGTGLSGGGDLTANRTLSVVYGTAAGTSVQGNDSRLSDQRTPLDGSVTNNKIADSNITISKLATTARPYDFSFVQSLDTRAVGYGEMIYGVRIAKSIVITSIHYRLGTSDGSGTTTCQIYTSSTAAGANAPLVGTSGTAAIDPTPITGSISISAGTYLYVYTSAIGTTPGKGLIAEIQAYLA